VSEVGPLPPQRDPAIVDRPYPLFIERLVLLLVLCSIVALVVLGARALPWSPWLTVPLMLPAAFVLWVSFGERLGGLVQLAHLDR
jgi:fatty acid desaturase